MIILFMSSSTAALRAVFILLGTERVCIYIYSYSVSFYLLPRIRSSKRALGERYMLL
jgi:hypothetical protein